MLIFSSFFDSPLGLIRLQSDGALLTALYFHDHEKTANQATAVFKEDLQIFKETKTFLNDYFQKRDPHFDLSKVTYSPT